MRKRMSVKPKPPCGIVCDSRAAACQTTCERCKAYEAERAAWYEENHLRQQIESIDAELRVRQHERCTKKKDRHRN